MRAPFILQMRHGRDPDADHRPTGGGKQTVRLRDRKAKPDSRNQNCENQRQDRHANGISGARTRIIGEHREEMRSPDAATADNSVEHDPRRAHAPLRGSRPVEQADGNRTSKKTHEAGQRHQAQIVFGGQAGEYAVHAAMADAVLPAEAYVLRLDAAEPDVQREPLSPTGPAQQ